MKCKFLYPDTVFKGLMDQTTKPRMPGSTPGAISAILLVLGLALILGLCSCGRQPAKESAPLLCYVGGTMRPAMEQLVKQYQAATGEKILLDFGDSGQLLIRVEQTRRGDIYICHDPFLAEGINKGLVAEGWTVSALDPVIVVRKGNPKGIKGFSDLAKPGLRLVLTDSQYSTMGHIVDRMAEKIGISGPLASNVVSRTRGGGEAANTVTMQTADASIVWNAVAYLRKDKLDAIPLEPGIHLQKGVDAVTSATYGRINMDYVQVTAALLKISTNPERARRFVNFMVSGEGQKVWEQFGFSPLIPGRSLHYVAGLDDQNKTLFVHCAAGMQKPVSRLALDFGKQRGAKVELNYGGSNRLLGQIKLTQRGDVYIAGDAEYIELAVKDGLTKAGQTLCYYVPVILVKKGNPLQVKMLSDLLKPGTRLGQGDEKGAAIGKQTLKILALNGMDRDLWNKNILLNTTTVNELGAAIKLDTIDAAIVWSSTAADYAEASDVVPINPTNNIISDVQGAVLSCSKDPELAQSFLDFLSSSNAMAVFQEYGYVMSKPEHGAK